MSSKTIEQLLPVKHEDVKPLYSGEEILDKLATAVHSFREMPHYFCNKEQKLEIELMYSICKALMK